MSKKLSKYISLFDCFDFFFFIYLIVLLVTSGSVFIASFARVIGIPIGIPSASLGLTFSLCTGLVKNIIKSNKK